MYTQRKFLNLSVDEYLQFEVQSQIRHEYIAGQVYAMEVGTDNCRIIVGNILTRLRTHLLGTNYRVFSSEMKVKIDNLDIFYYPDISITCDSQDRDKFFKTRPCLIVELFSPATERMHRHEKLMNYRQLQSLQEYVLVSQSEMKLDIYRKYNQQKWLLEQLEETDTMKLSSVGLEMAITEIYEDVEF